MTLRLALLALLLPACTATPGDDDPIDTATDPVVDADNDGFAADIDCDDQDAAIHPDADELCDGVDNNCDDVIDMDAVDGFSGWRDGDGDGFGAPDQAVTTCDETTIVANGDDCDDAHGDVHPDAIETCDGIDNDCDEVVDPGFVHVPGDHDTIQDAIDGSDDGDQLCLAAGTWTEVFDLSGRSLALHGAGGSEGTIFDLSQLDGPMVSMTNGIHLAQVGWDTGAEVAIGESSIHGFTITGLTDVEGLDWDQGQPASFLILMGESFTATDVVIRDNTWRLVDSGFDLQGGMMVVLRGELVFRDVVIEDNTWTVVDDGGEGVPDIEGGILLALESDVDVEGLVFRDNAMLSEGTPHQSGLDGLFALTEHGSLRLADTTFEDNEAVFQTVESLYIDGFLVDASHMEMELSNVQLQGNLMDVTSTESYTYVYGNVRCAACSGTFEDITLEDNDITIFGERWSYVYGGLYLAGYDAEDVVALDRVTAHGNTATASCGEEGCWSYGYGAGLYVSATANLSHLDVRNNHTVAQRVHGGGAHLGPYDLGTLSLTNSIFAGNIAGDAASERAYGGGLDLYAYEGDVTVQHITVYGNTAHSTVDSQGAGVRLRVGEPGHVDFDHVTSTGNTLVVDDTGEEAISLGADIAIGELVDPTWSHNNYGDLGDTRGETPFTGDETDLDVAPGFTDTSSDDPLAWDLTLTDTSPLVDAGDPTCLDADVTTCDIGAHGGEHGDW